MKKNHPLLSLFYSQHALSARVCLPVPWQTDPLVRKTSAVTPLQRCNHRKSLGADLNLHPLALLPLPKRHPLPCGAALQSPES